MKRLLALVAAVAMVAGAVLVRDRIDGGGGTGGGSAGGRGDGDAVALRCGTDLADACERLAAEDPRLVVTVEDEATTAAALVALPERDPAPFDAWLVAGPWPAMVATERERVGRDTTPLGDAVDTGARSPAVLVARADRLDALAGACGGPVTWSCIGERAGRPWTESGGSPTWGNLEPGLAAPDTGSGLVVLSGAVASELGRTDYASNDFDDDPAFGPWFDQLVGAATAAGPPGADPLGRFLAVPAEYGVVGALEAAAGPAVARAGAGRAALRVVVPEPVAVAAVALVPAAGSGDVADDLAEALPSVLAEGGWRVPGRAAAPGVADAPALPPGDGLPAPGVLVALRERWAAVR